MLARPQIEILGDTEKILTERVGGLAGAVHPSESRASRRPARAIGKGANVTEITGEVGLTLLERIPWCDFAPPPIALEAPREAWGSLGWTARAPSTTLSAKYFSVSPRISICDRANMG